MMELAILTVIVISAVVATLMKLNLNLKDKPDVFKCTVCSDRDCDCYQSG